MWHRPTPSHRTPKRFARNAPWTACGKAVFGHDTAFPQGSQAFQRAPDGKRCGVVRLLPIALQSASRGTRLGLRVARPSSAAAPLIWPFKCQPDTLLPLPTLFFAFQGGGRLTSVVRAGLWRLNRPMPSTVDHADIRGLVPPDLLRLGACSLFQRGLIPCGTTTSGARAPARLSNLHSATRCAVMSMNCAGTAGPPRAARTVLRRVAARVASTDPGPGGPGWGGISRLRGHALGFRGWLP